MHRDKPGLAGAAPSTGVDGGAGMATQTSMSAHGRQQPAAWVGLGPLDGTQALAIWSMTDGAFHSKTQYQRNFNVINVETTNSSLFPLADFLWYSEKINTPWPVSNTATIT